MPKETSYESSGLEQSCTDYDNENYMFEECAYLDSNKIDMYHNESELYGQSTLIHNKLGQVEQKVTRSGGVDISTEQDENIDDFDDVFTHTEDLDIGYMTNSGSSDDILNLDESPSMKNHEFSANNDSPLVQPLQAQPIVELHVTLDEYSQLAESEML